MRDEPLAAEWDFPTLAAWWNLYGLPALLVLAAFGLLAFRRRFREDRPGLIAVRAVALVHLVVGLRAGLGLAQEVLTLREQGIPQSFPVTGIILPALSLVMSLVIGHFLWRLRPWARRLAIGWNGLVGIVSALVAAWQWKYAAVVRLDQWPDYAASVALPWLIVAILLLPGPRARFAGPHAGTSQDVDGPRPLSATSVVGLLLLMLVASTLSVDALDWLVRALMPQEI